MNDVTKILAEIKKGSQQASDELLPIVYNELRNLATCKLAQERPGQTLQATALVHEAYLRLVGSSKDAAWDDRGHFFAAAAEAMRRILIEAARRKSRLKRGGHAARHELDEAQIAAPGKSDDILAVHEALDKLEATNPEAAKLVKLRYFAGFTISEAAEALAISPRKTNQVWAYARAWLLSEIGDGVTETS